MGTDYTDLNKTCPKDSYPLPSIDCLINGAVDEVLPKGGLCDVIMILKIHLQTNDP